MDKVRKPNISERTFMFRVGFEPTTPVFERANTVHALDCATIVIDFSQTCF
jgi:hypothetical protein